jgi:hypothetical protein
MSDREDDRCRMRTLLAKWRASGRPLSAFARGEGISRDKLEYWRRRLGVPSRGRAKRRSESGAVRFAPVRMTMSPAPVEITLPDGVRVTISEGAPESLVMSVVAALRRSC